MTDKKWAYSNYEDGDNWTLADSREDAIAEGREEATGDCFFVAPAHDVKITDVVYVDVDSILETIVESCEYIPECCEYWLRDVSKSATLDLKTRLENVLCHWMAENKLDPTWFEVGKTECIEVSDDN